MRGTGMMRRILTGVALLAAATTATAREVRAQGFDLVVNAAYPGETIARDVAIRVFLKQLTTLGGKPAAPVDQPKESPVRAAYSRGLHGRPVSLIEGYWQQQIFSGGNTPPPVMGSDAEVLAFVRANPGAIGYVSAGTAPGAGVKVVTIGN